MLTALENLAKNLLSSVCVDPTTRIWESHIRLSEIVEKSIQFYRLEIPDKGELHFVISISTRNGIRPQV